MGYGANFCMNGVTVCSVGHHDSLDYSQLRVDFEFGLALCPDCLDTENIILGGS
jgi:hypothetical protein